jgi:RimJ/RimL family protein N-acetyltransferase
MKLEILPLNPDIIDEEYISWFNDPQITKYLGIFGHALSKKELTDFAEMCMKSANNYYFIIMLQEEPGNNFKKIGTLKLGPINWVDRVSDLVCVIGNKTYWGKGLASKAIEKGNEFAFNELGLYKLSGGMISDNIGSVKTYQKAGWIIEGYLKNHYWRDGKFQDRVMVSCFNPRFFDEKQSFRI